MTWLTIVMPKSIFRLPSVGKLPPQKKSFSIQELLSCKQCRSQKQNQMFWTSFSSCYFCFTDGAFSRWSRLHWIHSDRTSIYQYLLLSANVPTKAERQKQKHIFAELLWLHRKYMRWKFVQRFLADYQQVCAKLVYRKTVRNLLLSTQISVYFNYAPKAMIQPGPETLTQNLQRITQFILGII